MSRGLRQQTVRLPAQPVKRLAHANLLDLRVPQSPLVAAAVTETTWPTASTMPLPIPARKPLSGLFWLATGGISAAVMVAGVFGSIKVLNAPVKASVAAASTSVLSAPAATPPTTPVAGVTSAQIKSVLDDFAASAGAPVSLVVKDLKTGQSSTIGSDQPITSASLYKLFVAHGIYRLIDIGKLSLSSQVSGTGSNVGECLAAMITVSDNGCGETMESMLGDGGYNQSLAEYGFSKTRFDFPTVTSAGDVATLLERLYNSTLLSPSSTQQFTDLLKNQHINDRLPQGLPDGTVIAHKTGDVFSFVHDAGIVYGPKTDYLVVMMSGPWNGVTNAPPKFAELSQKLYTLFNQ